MPSVLRTLVRVCFHYDSIISKDDFVFLDSQILFIAVLRKWYKILRIWLLYFYMLSPGRAWQSF